MALVFVNIGSNLGDRRRHISRAVRMIGERFGVFELSHIVESDAWGYESSNKFLNIAMVFRTDAPPLEVLHALQEIERAVGEAAVADGCSRESLQHRDANGGYADRCIDIDIMTMEDVRMATPELTLPHPHLRDRSFFWEPLQELLQQFEKHPEGLL